MPDPVTGAIAAGGTLLSANQQRKAAKAATSAQTDAANASIEEQRRQFDELQTLLSPYVQAGTGALGAQQNLIGLGGAGAQQQAIDALAGGPQMQSLIQQGENAILQNASATGGLRGGNTQGALAQFRPQLLNSLIDQQFGRLGGLAALGQNAAVGQGNAGMGMANSISGLNANIGQAQAQGALARGQIGSQLIGNLTGMGIARLGNMNNMAMNQQVANQFGTIPGSQQTQMLANQMSGF